MAEVDGMRIIENPAGEHILPGREDAHVHWLSPRASGTGKDFEHYEHDHGHEHHHGKKSILAKMKDKAIKWKHLLGKKKHGQDKDNVSPRLGVSLKEEVECEEKDPEYHGAPMYESEKAPDAYKEATLQPETAIRTPLAQKKSKSHRPRNAVIESEMKSSFDRHKKPELRHLDAIKLTSVEHATAKHLKIRDNQKMRAMTTNGEYINVTDGNKSLYEMGSEILAHTYFVVYEAAQKIASKIPHSWEETQAAGALLWAKGASWLEYIMHKLEPGEEDRALSQLITETVNQNDVNQSGEIVVEKVKGTLASLLGKERLPDPPIPFSTFPHTGEFEGSRCEETSRSMN